MIQPFNPADDESSAEQRRSFDRLVNFTDAVVAIAITLQLLPLADIPGPKDGETIWDVFGANYGQIYAFLLSFTIVIVMWVVHNRVFNVMERYDGTILWLNIGWMAAIVFLPWPTAMYGDGSSDAAIGYGGVGLVYWLNLALISLLGNLIAVHARRHPELLAPGALERGWLSGGTLIQARGAIFAAYFAFVGIMNEFIGPHASWLALGLIPLGRFINRSTGPRPSAKHPTAGPPSS